MSRVGTSENTYVLSSGDLYQADPWPKLFLAVVIEIQKQMHTIYKWKYDNEGETWNAIV